MGNPQSRWIPRWARGPISGLALILVLAIAGCASTVTVTGETGVGSTPTTAAPTPTTAPAPTGAAACLALSGFSGAVAATAGAGFDDMTFPSSSVSTTITASRGGDGRFTIRQFDVCTPSSTTSTIRSFYASGLPHAGWAQAPLYPYDGAYQASCGDPYCWKKDHAPRYISLEAVTAHSGGLVTYHIRLAIPPHEPDCTPDPDGIYASRSYDTTLPESNGAPAPPLTKDGLGDGFPGRFTNVGECSAGSESTIDAFFSGELITHGWHHSTPPSNVASACHSSGTQYWKGTYEFTWSTNGSAGSSGSYWQYSVCFVS